MFKSFTKISFCAASLFLTSCSFVPLLEEQSAVAPEAYPSGLAYDEELANQTENRRLSGIAWQNFFADQTLKDLIRTGLRNNRDLKVATLNIAEAQALYGIERSALFPDINADGGYTRQKTSGASASPPVSGSSTIYDSYDVSLGLTSYEIDLFGRVRSLSEAALNDYFATQAAQESVRISLIANIARSYATLMADWALLDLANETVNAQQDAFEIISLQAQEGIASDLDLRQAETLLHQARADRFQFINAVAQSMNALRLLLGTPEDMPSLQKEINIDFMEQMVASVPVGMPSGLLTSRPDIMAAEYQLKSANADIGAARAAFFPRISLTSAIGYTAGGFSHLFEENTQAWQFAPQVSVPVFTGGRLKNSLDAAKIRKEIEIINYEQAIETAFREVADALSAVGTADERVQAQADLVNATEKATELSQMRYDEGVENYLTVLDARRELYTAQQEFIRQKLAEINAKITLYQAVGGGRKTGLDSDS